jgi:serine protease Do
VPDSPAAKAGIQPGDVITKWNGRRVDDRVELILQVGREKIGSKVKLQVIRENRPIELTVEIVERPSFTEQ